MTRIGLILFGGPASGKDTITDELTRSDPEYRLYQRLKVGAGRTSGYRMGTEAELEQLRVAGAVIWENQRYGNVYVIDRAELERMEGANLLPVIHLGQREAVSELQKAEPGTRWLVVELWCSRPVAAARIAARATGDTAERLAAWDQTGHLNRPDLFIDTTHTSPADAAEQIRRKVQWLSQSLSPQ
ncbi:guanylate kinase [Streptomyces niveus]|uniref:guanylate kinase n=1 Tax=Streptomyces niveus TaxID=193462 RepID=UPI0037B3EDF1